MATVKPVFKARDDSEHESAAAAERRNKVIAAKEEFNDAIKRVKTALKEEILTADGVPFAPGPTGFNSYWYIWPSWGGLPRLERLSLWAYHAELSRDDDELVIRDFKHDRKDYVRYRFRELYHSEEAARKAYSKMLDDRLAELKEQAEEYKKTNRR